MCTIGMVYTQTGVLAFKNRDLIGNRRNIAPQTATGSAGPYIRFQAVEDEEFPGVWGGVNSHGLFVLGADGNAIEHHSGERFGDGRKTWETYEQILARTGDLDDAVARLIQAYNDIRVGESGDIILLGNADRGVIAEYTYKRWALQYIDPHEDVFGLRTNFFINMPHLRPAPETQSLHLSSAKRYERAMALLTSTRRETNISDLIALCSDHFWGENAFSICRHGGEGDYNTTGAAIFEVPRKGKIRCHYCLNSHPCETNFDVLEL